MRKIRLLVLLLTLSALLFGASTNKDDTEKNYESMDIRKVKKNNIYILDNKINQKYKKILEWRMKADGYFTIYVIVNTDNGRRFIIYTPQDKSEGFRKRSIKIGLGKDAMNGSWQTFNRDLANDIKDYEPNNRFISARVFVIRGSGVIDYVMLLDDIPNEIPIVNAGEDKITTVNEPVTLNGTATDSDGSIVSYEWKEGNNTLANSASFEYTPTTIGEHNLTLFATDNDGGIGSDTITINVKSSCDESTAITREELRDMIINGEDVTGVNTCKITDMSLLFSAYYKKNGYDWLEMASPMYELTQEQRNNLTNFNQDISGWDVSNVTDMTQMFYGTKLFNQNINGWDVSNVKKMRLMFYYAKAFNQPLGDWNVSNVTDMFGMFYDAIVFNQPIGDWDVSSVTDMSAMFGGTREFNQPIGDWDVSNVNAMWYMFRASWKFNQPIGDWNVSNVTTMTGMFSYSFVFDQPINDWDVSNVTRMGKMFLASRVFNQPLCDWNVSKVTDMTEMFFRTTIFNQDISNWDVSNVTRHDDFAKNTGLQAGYSPFLTD